MLWSLLLFIKFLLFILRRNFFRCLAVTDFWVGLIVQPPHAIFSMCPLIKMNVHDVFYVDLVRRPLSWCLCGVSILTSVAVSVDRLLALLLGLRYRHIVAFERVRVTIIIFVNWWFRGIDLDADKRFIIQGNLCYFDTLSSKYDFVPHEDSSQTLTSTSSATYLNNGPQAPVAIGEGIWAFHWI